MLQTANALLVAAAATANADPAWQVHNATSCENGGHVIKDMGKSLSLSQCEEACIGNPACGYINYAVQSDHHCILYHDCPSPDCRQGEGWWTTFQYMPHSQGPWPGCHRPSPGPPAPPGPPSRDDWSCIVARTAYAKSHQSLGGRGDRAVWASLDAFMGIQSCANTSAPLFDVPRQVAKGFRPEKEWTKSAVIFVSPTGNDDTGDGSQSKPFQTLHRAQEAVRTLKDRSGAVVNLLAGTYYLGDSGSLVFSAADSGQSASSPVTWQAYPPGAKVTVSGGIRLQNDCVPSTVNGVAAYKCSVPPTTVVQSLFINGMRQVRARFPNGSPLIPKDGYAKGAKALEQFPNTAVPVPANVFVRSPAGVVIATGSASGPGGNVTVYDIDHPRGVTTTSTAYRNSSRFNDSVNLPYWDTTNTQAISVPPSFKGRSWAKPSGAVVKMMHPAGWGSWAFQVADYISSTGRMDFAKGGFQEGRGSNGAGDMYIENLKEELDVPSEFFLDSDEGILYVIPEQGVDMRSAILEVPVLSRVVQFRGSIDKPAQFISWIGINVSHAAPTYLESYENPSGGDWSIHRGSAVFLDGAVGISLEQLQFNQVDGNAVFLSRYARNNTIKDCDFWRTGDTAVAAVGSGDMMNGTNPAYPAFNLIQGNHFDTVGICMKQTSCYFKALTYANTISNNVCHDGPRAGVNFNDGFMGGDLLEENVIWAMVTETGDHGTFNSWDRREWFYLCPPGSPHEFCFMPQLHTTRGNMFIGPAGWNMDHDDGSSEYHDDRNIVYLGGYKYRDGIHRNMTGNLMVRAAPAFQEFTDRDQADAGTDFFTNNFLTQGASGGAVCGPENLGGLSGNTVVTLIGTETLHGHATTTNNLSKGGSKCDPGVTKNLTIAEAELLAKSLVGLK